MGWCMKPDNVSDFAKRMGGGRMECARPEGIGFLHRLRGRLRLLLKRLRNA